MKKILLIAPSIGKVGGAERTAALLANSLTENDHFRFTLCLTYARDNEFDLNSKINKVYLPNKPLFKLLYRLNALSDLYKQNAYDLVVGYTIIGGILACLFKMIYCRSAKVIVCERQDPNAFSILYRLIRNVSYRYSDGAVFQTTDAQKYFKRICSDSIVIPNFINTRNLPPIIPYTKKKNTIISVGRLEKVKNHDMVIRSFSIVSRLFPAWDLYIYGEGSEKENLMNLIRQLEIEKKVFLPGYDSNVIGSISNSKILILASKYEGYPNALLEGMACGSFCISSDCPCGGPRDMIQNGENGFLIPDIDENKIVELLVKYMNDERQAAAIASNALKIRERNSVTVIIDRWASYFDKIISR